MTASAGGAGLHRVTLADVAACVFTPRPDDHKYRRGTVELRTGSVRYPGAAVLGVEAASRSGAGFVRYVGPSAVADAVLRTRPETVLEAGRADVVVAGSGMADRGSDGAVDERLRDVVGAAADGRPTVLDAGALDLLDAHAPRVAGAILTPHAGELAQLASRLLGRRVEVAEVEADQLGFAAAVADVTGATVLCKGRRTVVADTSACLRVDAPTSWLAVAGTGDVLAGCIGALVATASRRADDERPDRARLAAAGAWIHGRAGWLAARRVLDPATPASAALADDERLVDGAPGGPITAMDVARTLPAVIAAVAAA